MYTQQDVIAEHALYWLPVKSVSEARYLTAILNAPITTELVRQYQSTGLFGGRHFDTYPWQLPIPAYEATDLLHSRLVALSEACEEAAADIEHTTQGFQTTRANIRRILNERGLSDELNLAVSALLDANTSQ